MFVPLMVAGLWNDKRWAFTYIMSVEDSLCSLRCHIRVCVLKSKNMRYDLLSPPSSLQRTHCSAARLLKSEIIEIEIIEIEI